MSEQVIGYVGMLLVFMGATAGASYIFAMTAEREPERSRRSSSVTSLQ